LQRIAFCVQESLVTPRPGKIVALGMLVITRLRM